MSRNVLRGTAVTGIAVAGVLVSAQTAAHASTPQHDWSGVAQCESSGNWHINTGNGFYGGLQFTESTWLGYGGGAYAPRADLASEAAQIKIAERVLAGQGIGAWPVCGARLTSGVTPSTDRSKKIELRHVHRPAATKHATGTAHTYTVQSGDTLSSIAQDHHVAGGWRALVKLNPAITDPNRIYVGESIYL